MSQTFTSAADMADALLDLLDDEPELVAATPAEVADPFADLDDLLKEAVAAQAEKTAGERYRKALKSPGLSQAEAAEIQAKLREWEDRREWDSVAETALILRVFCKTCRTTKEQFGGFFKHQHHRTSRGLERWLSIPKPQGGLPKERAYRAVTEAHCPACLPLCGFGESTPAVIWEEGVGHV